jgi:hypothetical protein
MIETRGEDDSDNNKVVNVLQIVYAENLPVGNEAFLKTQKHKDI